MRLQILFKIPCLLPSMTSTSWSATDHKPQRYCHIIPLLQQARHLKVISESETHKDVIGEQLVHQLAAVEHDLLHILLAYSLLFC